MQGLSVDATPVERLQSIGEHRLSLSMFGNMSVSFNEHELKLKSRKSRALLAFLALSENIWETRERLIGTFWSESEEVKALASLRQSLGELRHVFACAGFDGLYSEKLAIKLDRNRLDIDLWDVLRATEVDARAHALLLNNNRITDSFLAGFDDLDSSFRVWLLAKRESIHDRLLRALETGLRNDRIDDHTKMELAEAIINLDPTHEETCRYLMRARAVSGDIAGALRVYKRLWDLLDDEYDMEPSAQTLKLVAEIKNGWGDLRQHEMTNPSLGFDHADIEDPSVLPSGRFSAEFSQSPDYIPSRRRTTPSPDQDDETLRVVLDYVQLAVGFVGRQSVSETYLWPQISVSNLPTQSASVLIDAHKYLTKVLADRDSCSILLLGDYGSGKTSFCYMLGRELGLLALESHGISLIPLYLNLKKLRLGESVFDALARSLSDYGLSTSAHMLRHFCAQRSRVLLLLDGLDESGERSAIPSIGPILSSLRELREVPGLSWILTSRSTFFSSDADVDQLGADIVAELQRFTEADVRRYVEGAKLTNDAEINSLFRDNAELVEMCKTPVHLYLLVTLLRHTADVESMVPLQHKWSINILYDEFIRYSVNANFTVRLAKWRIEHRLQLLRRLAFHWFKNRIYEWPIDRFEAFVFEASSDAPESSEIVDRAAHIANCGFFTRAHDKFRFIHLSILEYLTAWHLAEELFAGEFDSWEEPLYTEVYEFIALIVRARSNDISVPTRKLMTSGGMRTQANFAAMAFRHRFEEILPYLRKMMLSPVGLHRALSMQGIGLYPPSQENVDALMECARAEGNGIIGTMTTLIAHYWTRNYDDVPRETLLNGLKTKGFAITASDAQEILGDDTDGGIIRAFRKSLIQPNAYWTAPAIDLLVLAARGDHESFSAIRRIGYTTDIDEIRRAFLAVESLIDDTGSRIVG